MTTPQRADEAARAIEAIDEAYAKATPGEWGAFNCDDSHCMNMWGLTVYGPNAYGEPNDEDDLGNVLMVSCVQMPARFVCENDEANLDFIALAHNHWPAARAHIRTLEAENARLTAALADAKAEGERMRKALELIHYNTGGAKALKDSFLVRCLREVHEDAAAALASGGQAGKGN